MLSQEVLAIHKLLHMEMMYNTKSHELMNVMKSRLQKKRISVWRKEHAQMLSSANNMMKSTVQNIRRRSISSKGMKDDDVKNVYTFASNNKSNEKEKPHHSNEGDVDFRRAKEKEDSQHSNEGGIDFL